MQALNARAAALASAARALRLTRQRQDGGDRFRRPQYRQAHACRSSALLHHRRLPAAAVPRQWLAGGQRRASGRLGPADGPADLRDRTSRHRARSISTPNVTGPYPEQSPVTMEDLEEIYPRASAACKADPARLEAARRATVDLQAGRPGYRALWQHFVKVSEAGLEREFGSPGRQFDLWNGESSVDALIAPMIEDLKTRGLAEMSEGALVIAGRQRRRQEADAAADPGEVGRRGALRHHRSGHHHRAGARIESRSDSLCGGSAPARPFRAGVPRRATRPASPARRQLEHVGFGTMNGPDGKPFKTRAGGVMKLYDLIAMATAEAEKRLAEQGIGADYSAGRTRGDRAQGRHRHHQIRRSLQPPHHRLHLRSGALLANSRARPGPICNMPRCASSRSCARRANEGHADRRRPPSIRRRNAALVLQLLSLRRRAGGGRGEARAQHPVRICLRAGAEFQPLLCASITSCPKPDADLRAARLGLCALTLAVLTRVLGLLGIEVPERM